MARVKLQLPTFQLFAAIIPVRISDINYGNHVGNDSFISIIHEARVQWLKQHEFTELSIEGLGLIMADLQVEFKKEVFYPETITVKIFVSDISTVSFDLYYKLSVERNDEMLDVAYAKTGMVCFNYLQKKISAIPNGLKKIFDAAAEKSRV